MLTYRPALLTSFLYIDIYRTHNHGTEKDSDFGHHSGNTDPKGFSAVGFVTDNLVGAV
jgi:hypothetical protein